MVQVVKYDAFGGLRDAATSIGEGMEKRRKRRRGQDILSGLSDEDRKLFGGLADDPDEISKALITRQTAREGRGAGNASTSLTDQRERIAKFLEYDMDLREHALNITDEAAREAFYQKNIQAAAELYNLPMSVIQDQGSGMREQRPIAPTSEPQPYEMGLNQKPVVRPITAPFTGPQGPSPTMEKFNQNKEIGALDNKYKLQQIGATGSEERKTDAAYFTLGGDAGSVGGTGPWAAQVEAAKKRKLLGGR